MTTHVTALWFAPMLVAGLVCYFLTPPVMRLAAAIGMMDRPDPRRIHKRPTPRGGGLAVFAGFHIAGLMLFGLRIIAPELDEAAAWWLRILPASLFLAAVGLVDDRFGMPPTIKLAGQVLAALLAFASNIHFEHLLGIDLPPLVDLVLTVGWFLGFVNAFNLIDGLDGLASGLAVIAALGLAGAMWLRGAAPTLPLALALLGAALAFLRYNFFPARVFLGDTGSMFLGFTLAGLAMTAQAKGTFLVSVVVPVLAIGVPVFDTLLAVWRRSVRRWNQRHLDQDQGDAGKVFSADADHLHHRLLKEFKSQRAVAVYLYTLNALIAAAGLGAALFQSCTVAIYLSTLVTAAFVLFRHAACVEIWDSGIAIVHGLTRPPRRRMASLCYPGADLLLLLCAWLLAVLLNPADALPLFSRQHALDGMIWIGVPFICLAFSGTYNRVWSLARLSDLALLVAALAAGLLLAAAIQALRPEASLAALVGTVMTLWAVAVTAVAGVRVFPRFIQDLLPRLWHRRAQAGAAAPLRTLVYSANSGCTIFLRAMTQNGIRELRKRHIVGLLDEDANLHGRMVYGLRVFGGLATLAEQVRKHAINELVVACAPSREEQRALQQEAERLQLRLLYWSAELSAEPASAQPVPSLAARVAA